MDDSYDTRSLFLGRSVSDAPHVQLVIQPTYEVITDMLHVDAHIAFLVVLYGIRRVVSHQQEDHAYLLRCA